MEQGPGWACTDHVCAIETTGGIHCWGSDLFGQATVPWRVLGCVVLALVLGFGAIAVGFEIFFEMQPAFSEPYPLAL